MQVGIPSKLSQTIIWHQEWRVRETNPDLKTEVPSRDHVEILDSTADPDVVLDEIAAHNLKTQCRTSAPQCRRFKQNEREIRNREEEIRTSAPGVARQELMSPPPAAAVY